MIDVPQFAAAVTSRDSDREPFHRWLHFKQGYSPALVRAFLTENRPRGGRRPGPILDPFSGSGTCVIECGHQNVSAIGIEAIPSLAFLTNCTFEREFPSLPQSEPRTSVRADSSAPSVERAMSACRPPYQGGQQGVREPRASARADSKQNDWRKIAAHLEHPLHRAALMLAVARQYTTAGKFNRGAKPLESLLADVIATMNEDLRTPIPQINASQVGDARNLHGIADQSIGGIITSPPYLSRHDYSRITAPLEAVHRLWFGPNSKSACAPSTQLPAHARALTGTKKFDQFQLDDAAAKPCLDEIASSLAATGQSDWIKIVCQYFDDMHRVLIECRRVLAENACCWIVIGGARLGDVYVPADLMVAELADHCGFRVAEIRVARDLVTPRRKFGSAGHIAPRESILVIERDGP